MGEFKLKLVRVAKIDSKYRENTVIVKMANYAVAKRGELLSTWALGSCLAIILYDPRTKLASLAHSMLPEPLEAVDYPGKYVSTAIPVMIDEFKKQGVKVGSLRAGIVGGARILRFSQENGLSTTRIGLRNARKAKMILHRLGIRIDVEDVGGTRGRNVVFNPSSGEVVVSYAGKSWLEVSHP